MRRLSLILLVLGSLLGCVAPGQRPQGTLPGNATAPPTPGPPGPRRPTADPQGDVAQALHRGEAAYQRQDYGAALHAWQPLAQHGQAGAQNWLGELYAKGLGVAQDDAAAVRWFQQAAAQGLASAQNNLGRMYAEGRGVPQDDAMAVHLFQQAAAQGAAGAQQNLGRMYAEGRGVARDLTVAQRWYTQAAATFPPGANRDKAIEARDRVMRQLTGGATSPPAGGGASPPAPPSRRALVIGNTRYPDRPLRNPVHDASDMADTLRRLHFEVQLLFDATKQQMEEAIVRFTTGVPPNTAGVFFFSGHGTQLKGLNYLLPLTHAEALRTEGDVKYQTVQADWILARMEESGMAVKILILDACRDQPFRRSWTRGWCIN